jgi:hypothetical protein
VRVKASEYLVSEVRRKKRFSLSRVLVRIIRRPSALAITIAAKHKASFTQKGISLFQESQLEL